MIAYSSSAVPGVDQNLSFLGGASKKAAKIADIVGDAIKSRSWRDPCYGGALAPGVQHAMTCERESRELWRGYAYVVDMFALA